MIWIRYALNAAVLIYGGVTDYKRREIPNLVPLVLILTGLLDYRTILFRLLCLLVMALILWLSGKITKAELPGGDLKLLCVLAFSEAIPMTLLLLLLVGFGAAGLSVLKKKPMRRSIPLCSYAAPAYLLLAFFAFLRAAG